MNSVCPALLGNNPSKAFANQPSIMYPLIQDMVIVATLVWLRKCRSHI